MAKNILILRFPFTSAFGGLEKHTLNLFQKLKEKNINFFLLSSCPILLVEFKKRNWPAKKTWGSKEPVTIKRVLFFPLIAPLVFLNLWPRLFYYRLFKKTKILYCLSLTEKLILTIPARLIGYKVFWIEHVIPGRWLRLNPFRPLYIFNSYFAKIIAVSDAVQKKLIGLKASRKNIRLIYNGIAIKEELDEKNKRENLVAQTKINQTVFTIGTVCRLNKEKGIEYLLRAVSIAKDFIPSLQLIVIGDGPEKKNLIWLAKKLEIGDRTQFVGFQEELTNWIDGFEIFILPSVKKEAFGLVLLDAMAKAKPIIATKIGGIPEVILDQITGILIEPKNSEAIANAILHLFNHPKERARMGKNGLERVKTFFTLQRMAEEYYKLFYG
jgi:glycosyltransferase involved in cell wall biosynthesis